MFKNMYLKMSQNIPKCLNMSNGQKCLKNIEKNRPKSIKTSENVQNVQKMSKNVQKMSRNIKNKNMLT